MVDLLLHDGGTGNELPGKVVDVETFRMFGNISIRFDWSWTNTVLRTTQAFQTVIHLLVSIFEHQKNPNEPGYIASLVPPFQRNNIWKDHDGSGCLSLSTRSLRRHIESESSLALRGHPTVESEEVGFRADWKKGEEDGSGGGRFFGCDREEGLGGCGCQVQLSKKSKRLRETEIDLVGRTPTE